MLNHWRNIYRDSTTFVVHAKSVSRLWNSIEARRFDVTLCVAILHATLPFSTLIIGVYQSEQEFHQLNHISRPESKIMHQRCTLVHTTAHTVHTWRQRMYKQYAKVKNELHHHVAKIWTCKPMCWRALKHCTHSLSLSKHIHCNFQNTFIVTF